MAFILKRLTRLRVRAWVPPLPLKSESAERVKVDSRHFLAVGEVAHRERIAEETRAGLRFLAVRFRAARGAFVWIEA